MYTMSMVVYAEVNRLDPLVSLKPVEKAEEIKTLSLRAKKLNPNLIIYLKSTQLRKVSEYSSVLDCGRRTVKRTIWFRFEWHTIENHFLHKHLQNTHTHTQNHQQLLKSRLVD